MGLQGPHFEYLTNSYVNWLGLEPFMYVHPDPVYIDVQIADGIKLLDVPMTSMDFAVVYNHALYLREPDGLAWSRKT